MNNEINQVVYAVTEDYGDGPNVVEIFSTRAFADEFLAKHRAVSTWASREVVEWTVDGKADHQQFVTLPPLLR